MIIHWDLEQGSADWIQMRFGKLTASRAASLITPKKKELSKPGQETLINEMIFEQIAGKPSTAFKGTFWTELGIALEDQSIAYFEMQTDNTIKPCGFIEHPDKPIGASPDGVVISPDGEIVGGIEVKNLEGGNHIAVLRAGEVPDKHVPQIQFSLWLTGWPEWWFLAYSPDAPPFLKKVYRDQEWHSAFSTHVDPFITKYQAELDRVRGM